MNKKKILTLLVTTTLLAVVGVGSTLAYFTDKTETLTNVVTMGRVEGRLVENDIKKDDITKKWVIDDTAKPIITKGLDYTGIIPGDTIVKNPMVHLMPGSADAWVRVSFEITGDKTWLETPKFYPNLGYLTNKQRIEKIIKENIDGRRWHNNLWENVYYYKDKLTAPDSLDKETNYLLNLAEESTKATLFDKFVFPIDFDNSAATKTFNIVVKADLIQGDYVELRKGWDQKWNWYPVNNVWAQPLTDIQDFIE